MAGSAGSKIIIRKVERKLCSYSTIHDIVGSSTSLQFLFLKKCNLDRDQWVVDGGKNNSKQKTGRWLSRLRSMYPLS